MNASHPSAGLYVPSTPGATTVEESRPLRLMGEPVSAVVGPDGAYSVLIGGRVVAQDFLDGTEGDLMAFFAEEAVLAGGTDEEASAVLTARASSQPDPDPEELPKRIQAVGGLYQSRGRLVSSEWLSQHIRSVLRTGVTVSEGSDCLGTYYIELRRGPLVYDQYYKES